MGGTPRLTIGARDMIITLLLFCISYFIVTLLLLKGIQRKYDKSGSQPTISILIPARNEGENIERCLYSLANLDYPANKLEILILNDRSTDETAMIAQNFCTKYKHFRLLTIEKDDAGLSGKMNVLAQGLESATGEIILVTDADCEVNRPWAAGLVSYFTCDTGMVGGVTVLARPDRNESWFTRIQALDWLYLQCVAAGMTGIGHPVSILGNNFAFRKAAYEAVGGFRKIGFSLTEDMALMQAIIRRTNWKIKYTLYPETLIYSQAEKTIKSLVQQRLRWLSGGLKSPLGGWIIMLIAFFTHLSIGLAFFLNGLWLAALPGLIAVFVADFSLLYLLIRRLYLHYLMSSFVPFELYYFIYSIFLAILAPFRPRLTWKNRSYK